MDEQEKKEVKGMNFRRKLTILLNMASRENESETPDFLLSNFLIRCLEAYEQTVRERDQFFGFHIKGIPLKKTVRHEPEQKKKELKE